MKILVSWLREFVDLPGTPDVLARDLSLRGFALEGMDAAPAGAARPGAPEGPDAVLDVEVTPNRPDAMSILGIAREVATMYGLPLRTPRREPDGGRQPAVGDREHPLALAALEVVATSDIEVRIDEPDLCPRYAGAVVDVTIGPSPAWMQARLIACGVRPISNVVDVTNYVNLELGQPMHAFDLARLAGSRIVVRRARSGERITTLDDEARELTPEMLVIADAERAQAIAGVMGGADSEVSNASTAIVLESAWFQPQSVRRTSRRLALRTEASTRFERGADIGMTLTAMERAVALLALVGGGRARGTVVDACPRPHQPRVLTLRRDAVRRLLGHDVPASDIERILAGLGFLVAPSATAGPAVPGAAGESSGLWQVTTPAWRVDCLRAVDLIEEIGRHYGLDRLPATFPALCEAAHAPDPRITRDRRLRRLLTGAGFSEALTFGFVASAAAAPFAAADDVVAIANPLSENYGVLRPSVLPGLLAAVAHNRRRERRDVRLFEIGNRFSRLSGERRALAFAWTGAGTEEHFSAKPRPTDFFDVKGVVELVCGALGVEPRVAAADVPWLVAGRAARVSVQDAVVGSVGLLLPAIADTYDVPAGEDIYVAELDLDALRAIVSDHTLRVEPLPRFPSIVRDLSMLVDDTLPAETVRGTIRSVAPATLVRVREFDRYQGQGIPEGKVSLSVRLTFQSSERTLTDAEVQAATDAIVAGLRERHGAVQR